MGTEHDRLQIFSAHQWKPSWQQSPSNPAGPYLGNVQFSTEESKLGCLFSGCVEKTNCSEGFVLQLCSLQKEDIVNRLESRVSSGPEVPQHFITTLENGVHGLCLTGPQGANTGFLWRHSSKALHSLTISPGFISLTDFTRKCFSVYLGQCPV